MKAVFWSFFLILIMSYSLNVYGQDDCFTATHLEIENYSTCGDMALENINLGSGSNSPTVPLPTCGGFDGGVNDLWYTITVPAGVNEMAFHVFNSDYVPLLFGSSKPNIAIYRGADCASLTLLDCFEHDGGFLDNGEVRWGIVGGLIAGETIYMRVWDEDNTDQNIFLAASVRTDMPEDDCSTPMELTSSGCNILSTGGDIEAPGECGWGTTDNSIFFHFTVTAGDPQPYIISVDGGECWSNDGSETPEIQFAVYSWNGLDCDGIGGTGTSYYGCANGTGVVELSVDLPPGQYILAMDGYSMTNGNSLCVFGFDAPYIPEELDVTLTTVDNGCGQQGSATITVNSSCNGNPTIEWSNLATGPTASNLAPGNYEVTVTDDAACGDTVIAFTINSLNTFAVAITPSGNPCSGSVTATASVMGANPGDVSFLWTGGYTTQSIVLNTPGTYTVTATYGSCVDESTPYTFVDGDFDFSINYTPVICVGGTGSAQFNLISGTGPFMYEWSGGVGALIGAGIGIDAPGNYCLTVTDENSGCQLTRCITVTEVPAVDVTITTDHITCHNFNDGKVTAIALGGTAPYAYVWNGYIQGETMDHLLSGNYNVVVTDINGCTGYATTFVENPPQFSYGINNPEGICFGEQADLHVSANGGVEPYLYSWNDALNLNSPDRTVSPQITTLYTVSVYDANGCVFPAQSTTVVVSQPIVITVNTENVLCHGVCEGSAVLDIDGGIPPFVFDWGSTNDHWENLCAGDYSVSLTDHIGCVGDANFTITQPDTIYLTMWAGPASCYGYNDGFAEIDVMGGVPFTNEFGEFYQYQWNNGMSQDSIALGYGQYTVTVSDANGCEHVAMAFIDQPEAIIVIPPWDGIICIGEEFSTSVAATGGTILPESDYDFTWTGTDGSIMYGEILTVSPVVTTSYQLVVTDDIGCFGPLQNITVVVHPPISIFGTNTNLDDICIGESITVEMDIEGGNGGPYTIERDNAGIVNIPHTFYPQETGFYHFTISDNCGSPTDQDSVYVVVHPLPQVAFFADKTNSCPPGVFQFTETSPDFGQTFLWNFGDAGFSVQKNPVHTYTETGTYDVAVTAWSEFGCQKTRTYDNMIFIHPVPRAEFTALPEVVSVLDARIELTNYTDGGTTFFWDFDDGTSSLWTTDPQIHKYTAIGEYNIVLVAKNQYECVDSISKKIRVHDEFAFYAPEAFTPNGDGLNDYFYVIGHGIDKSQFYMVIYDRFGTKVFETETWDAENPYRMAWDGSHDGNVAKGDPIISNGMYRWYANFVDFTGKPHEASGTVTLIR